jgi:ATP-dependent Clp protease ATP-binding subunit ClpC
MDDHLNVRVQRILSRAQDEARALNHDAVGTEHILLALLAEGEGIAVKALEEIGVDLVAVSRALDEAVIRGPRATSGWLPLTRQGARVLELARAEATRLGRGQVGTEHILLGLIGEGDGIAARVLLGMGVTLELTRGQVTEFTHGRQGRKPPEDARHPVTVGQHPADAKLVSGRPTALARCGLNLTQRARDGELYPAVGREQEIEAVIQGLSRSPSTILLLAGTLAARATVVDGLAQRIVSGEVPDDLKNAQLYYCGPDALTTAAAPVAAHEMLAAVIAEAEARPDLIVILDDLPSLTADPLSRPLLTGAKGRIIGTATLAAYRKRAAADNAFAQRTCLIQVPEVTTAYAVSKLRIALRATVQAATSNDSNLSGLPSIMEE